MINIFIITRRYLAYVSIIFPCFIPVPMCGVASIKPAMVSSPQPPLIATFMGPTWGPCWPHEPCFQGPITIPHIVTAAYGSISGNINDTHWPSSCWNYFKKYKYIPKFSISQYWHGTSYSYPSLWKARMCALSFTYKRLAKPALEVGYE